MQVRLPVALHHVLRAHLSGQHVRQTGGTFNAQVVSNGRVAKISVDKQYFRTIFSKGHRSVDSHGGLAFGRLRRRDDKQLAHAFGAVGLQEVDIRMNTAEFLGNSAVRLAHQHRTLIIKRSVHRNGAKGGCSDDAAHVGSLFNLGVEEVFDECGEHADDDAEHHTDSQIQGSLRRRLRRRDLCLLHDGKLHRGLISGVQVAFNDVLQRFGNGIGDVRGLLRISIHHGNVHECGVGRIGDGDLAGKIRHGFIQAKIINNRLEHLRSGGKRRI